MNIIQCTMLLDNSSNTKVCKQCTSDITIVYINGLIVYKLLSIQERFNTEVLQPYEEQKAVFTSLKSSAALLPDQQSSEEAFGKFESVSVTVERYVCGSKNSVC